MTCLTLGPETSTDPPMPDVTDPVILTTTEAEVTTTIPDSGREKKETAEAFSAKVAAS